MNRIPIDAPIVEDARKTFSLPWRMWLSSIVKILTGVQYTAVSSYQTPINGFSIAADSTVSKLILTPASGLSSGAVTLPATPFEGMEFRITTTESISSFSLLAASGQTVKNPPSSLAAGAGVGYTYSAANSTWYPLYSTDSSIMSGSTSLDAFGRLRTSAPYTLFDSQNRYSADTQFDTATANGGSTTYLANESTVAMDVSTVSGSSVVRQSFRNFAYQPGKGLLFMATFVMNPAQVGLRQRVGYFNSQNGIFLELSDSTLSIVLRSNSLPTPGTPSDVRSVPQSSWNVDKLDGTGPSGIVLDITKSQILWADFEWLGVGQVRVGFFQDGQFVVCHKFDNENSLAAVYMTTAILPIRYEISNTSATAASARLKQVCSTVMIEGGYAQTSLTNVARRASSLTGIGSTFLPLISIRMASTAIGGVVLLNYPSVIPLTADTFEVVVVKNPTLTGASWSATSDANVEQDTSATAYSGGTIVQSYYVASSNQSSSPISPTKDYSWNLQIGASISGTSDIFTVGIRTISGSGTAIGAISFYDLTL